ncbi:phage holin family protein [Paracoccus sp. (in: a-proteobacteria)]|uniref:phage holin family protein n=1 Tax=Paracoccus sp. TaxID=267 RepID=UPI0026DEF44E|nr:phage holin family protein [Paracoccus sp. (in: a-proteobacteria)]MDO5647220.1 phage holin family protein [Paracoccus sp. (in: a-proteobacteria)]
MFDYAHRLKLALSDTARRSALKIGAGVVGLIAVCYLMSALWWFLNLTMELGPTLASLIIGVVLAAIAGVVFVLGNKTQHQMPTTDELKREVEARVTLAADAATDRARVEMARAVDMAERKVHSLMDEAGERANAFAYNAERRVMGTVRDTAASVGLTTQNLQTARRKAEHGVATAKRAANTNAGSMAKVLGAFAVGVTLAAKVAESRRRDDDDYYV